MSLFEDLEGYADSLLPIRKSIYDHVIVDSHVQRDFAQALENMDEVKLFVKLPAWFTVPTPIGDYNPDWAIVFHAQDAFGEVREKLYLVRETKGTDDPEGLCAHAPEDDRAIIITVYEPDPDRWIDFRRRITP